MSGTGRHLIVLVHGYMGSTFGMRDLAAALQRPDTLVHVATFAGDDSQLSLLATADGIEFGGRRLATEIRRVVAMHSLSRISLVGVSLGGVYCRWLAHELADLRAGTIAGLRPHVFISVASPHLGVAHSLNSVHQAAAVAASYVGERTAWQLLGRDEYAQLAQLTSPAALAAWNLFARRYLFANLVNDTRVDYCSAALLRAPHQALHDEAAVDDLEREVVGVYDVLDYQGDRTYPPYATGAQLEDKQLAMLDAIRASELRFTNIDLRLDKSWFSRQFAHIIPLGLFSRWWGGHGAESMQRIVQCLVE